MTQIADEALELIYTEALKLDEQKYEEWLDLFSEDCRYWAPYRWNAAEPLNTMNLLYDDRARLSERVNRLTGGDLHAQDPASHTVRTIGQVLIPTDLEWQPKGKFDTVVTAPFTIFEYRTEETTTYAGRYTYWLDNTDDGWKITAKKIQLQGVEGPLGNLTFLL